MCMCLARGSVGGEGDKRIGFGLYQSCGNKESVGRMFGLWWCRCGVGMGLGSGSGGVVLCGCEW